MITGIRDDSYGHKLQRGAVGGSGTEAKRFRMPTKGTACTLKQLLSPAKAGAETILRARSLALIGYGLRAVAPNRMELHASTPLFATRSARGHGRADSGH